MGKKSVFLWGLLLLTLCACSGTDTTAQADDAGVQYDYQLQAGETTEVYDTVFDEMVTVTVDPESTRDGSYELRSDIFFDNCTFNGGLTIVGDYHAMITLGGSCSFGDGAVVTCKEATDGAAEDTVLEDNLVKLMVCCDGVTVETEAAMGILSNGPDVVCNGTTYSKEELAPDWDFLGVYNLYEQGEMTCRKLALGEDNSIEFLD